VQENKEVTSGVKATGGAAANELEQVYARLRRIANRLMQFERPGHTLCPTEVVHEAMARSLDESGRLDGELSLVEMIGRMSRVMRQVLVDHARRKRAVKHGGGRGRVGLDQIDDIEAAIDSPAFDWVKLDHALAELAQHDARRHQVVTLRFFGGLDNRQIARQLKLDERTVGRDWAAARLWLKKQLQSDDDGANHPV
jgi:RNA polymerase sigma factor (TIGR02999 family)